MAYFDNAATTYPKPECVYTDMDHYYRENGTSAGRGNYKKAISTNQLIRDTRQRIQSILKCPAKQVVFTPTATIALNIIIQGLLQGENKIVYITPFEHNAVTRTLHPYESSDKAKVLQLKVNSQLQYDLDGIAQQFDECPPDLLIMSHASNVC